MTTRLPYVAFGDLLNHQAATAQRAELEFWKGQFQSLSVQMENFALALRRGETVELYDRDGRMLVKQVQEKTDG